MKGINMIIMIFMCTNLLIAQSVVENIGKPYEFNNSLKISPIELGRAEFQVSYERFMKNRQQSIVLMPSAILGKSGKESRSGVQFIAQYRFYLSHLRKETHNTLNMYNVGFYAAPYALGLTLNEIEEVGVYDPITFEYDYTLVESNLFSIEAGALMGIQLDITKRIVLDFYAGGGLRRSEIERDSENVAEDYGILDLEYTGVKPRIGFSMGITF